MSKSFSRDDLIEKIKKSGKNGMVSQEAAIAIVNSMLNIESDHFVAPQEEAHNFQPLVINPQEGDEQKNVLNLSENFKINLRPQDAKGNYQTGFNLYGDTQSYLFITEAEGSIGVNNVCSPQALLHIGTDDAGKLHKFYIGTEKQASFLIDKNNNVAIHGSLALGQDSEDKAEINIFSKDVALGGEKTSDNKVSTQKAVKMYIDEATKQCTNAIDKLPVKIDAKYEEVKKFYIEDINKIPAKIDAKVLALKNEIYKEKFGAITAVNGLKVEDIKEGIKLGSCDTSSPGKGKSSAKPEGILLNIASGLTFFRNDKHYCITVCDSSYGKSEDVALAIYSNYKGGKIFEIDGLGSANLIKNLTVHGDSIKLGSCGNLGKIKPNTKEQDVSLSKSSGLTFARDDMQFSINTHPNGNALEIYSTTEPHTYPDGKPLFQIDQYGSVSIQGNLTLWGNLLVRGESQQTGKVHYLDGWDRDEKWKNIWQASDVRFKKNIQPLSSILSKLLLIEPVSYQWNEVYAEVNKITLENILNQQLGVIAQEVEKVFPELVGEENGYKAVNYQGLIPVLLSAVKEQQNMIEELKQQIINIQQQLNKK